MIVRFEEKYLEELYTEGKCSNRKHRYQPELIKAYAKCVYRMEEALNIESLYKYNALRYEVLLGDKKGISSVQVNDKYRIEFNVTQTGEEPIITICTIIALSNHYKS